MTLFGLLVLSLSAFALSAGHAKDDDDDHDYNDNDRGHHHVKIKIYENQKLAFGIVASSYDGPGTATVSTSGALSTTGYAISMGGNPRAAHYKIRGPKNGWVVINLPTSATVYSHAGTAMLTNFVSDPPEGLVQLDHKGKLTLKMGATLTVPAGQAGGRYRGHFTVYADPQ